KLPKRIGMSGARLNISPTWQGRRSRRDRTAAICLPGCGRGKSGQSEKIHLTPRPPLRIQFTLRHLREGRGSGESEKRSKGPGDGCGVVKEGLNEAQAKPKQGISGQAAFGEIGAKFGFIKGQGAQGQGPGGG